MQMVLDPHNGCLEISFDGKKQEPIRIFGWLKDTDGCFAAVPSKKDSFALAVAALNEINPHTSSIR